MTGRIPAVVAVAAAGAAGYAVAELLRQALAGEGAPWLLGRAAGITSFLLMTALVWTGLLVTHPRVRGVRRPSARMRLALHSVLATFTLLFTALHVLVLATDPWADVGWGALLPMASQYRPVPVTLGVIALWAGLLTGLTARWAGRFGRFWWPVHKTAVVVYALVWAHSVLAGTDTQLLRWFYLATGVATAALALTRRVARTPADEAAELEQDLRLPMPAVEHR